MLAENNHCSRLRHATTGLKPPLQNQYRGLSPFVQALVDYTPFCAGQIPFKGLRENDKTVFEDQP